MHRSTLATRRASGTAHQLSDDCSCRNPSVESKPVAAIRSDDRVFGRDGGFHAGSDRFLAGGQVAEAANQLGFVRLVAGGLQPADRDHRFEQAQQLLARRGGAVGRGGAQVGLEGLWGEGKGVAGPCLQSQQPLEHEKLAPPTTKSHSSTINY